MMAKIALAALLLALLRSVMAVDVPLQFNDTQEESRFRALATELRCLVCQNQSIEDSHAPLAQDLRKEVLRLMREGKSDAQIKTFLTQRYGDFVLYRPGISPLTLGLWLGPLILLVLGMLFAWRHWRAHHLVSTEVLDENARKRAQAIILQDSARGSEQ